MDTEIILICIDMQVNMKSENSMKYKFWGMKNIWWSHNRIKSPLLKESIATLQKFILTHYHNRDVVKYGLPNVLVPLGFTEALTLSIENPNVEHPICNKVKSINIKVVMWNGKLWSIQKNEEI